MMIEGDADGIRIVQDRKENVIAAESGGHHVPLCYKDQPPHVVQGQRDEKRDDEERRSEEGRHQV